MLTAPLDLATSVSYITSRPQLPQLCHGDANGDCPVLDIATGTAALTVLRGRQTTRRVVLTAGRAFLSVL